MKIRVVLLSLSQLVGGYERCGADVCPHVLLHEYKYNPRLSAIRTISAEVASSRGLYDYIIVGGGGAGCPLARTLADGGNRVLLVERGGLRRDHILTQDIYGAGMVIGDERVSQPVVTPSGVRTHLGNVLGGGTATGMAISIEEDEDYITELSRLSNESICLAEYHASLKWLRDRTSQPMTLAQPYSSSLRDALRGEGFSVRHGASYQVRTDGTWNGYSLFNSSDGYFRNSADVLIGSPEHPQPDTLDVLVHTFAENLIFSPGSRPTAECVVLRPSLPQDSALYDGRTARTTSAWLLAAARGRPWVKEALEQSRTHKQNAYQKIIDQGSQGKEVIICAKKEIILSAGPVGTVTLLARSGVGNREQMEVLRNNEPVKIIPALGRNLIDRGLIPVAYFREDGVDAEEVLPPQVCGIIGLAPVGPDCSKYHVNQETRQCTLTGAEEITGGRILEGFLMATRILFPPELRSSLVVDALVLVAAYCSDRVRHTPVCEFLQDGVQCLRKLSAMWYFVSEPKSRGEVQLQLDGNVVVDPKYFSHPQDVEDGIRGISNLLRIVQNNSLMGVMESSSAATCPWAVSTFTGASLKAVQKFSRKVLSSADIAAFDTYDFDPRGPVAASAAYKTARKTYKPEHNKLADVSATMRDDVLSDDRQLSVELMRLLSGQKILESLEHDLHTNASSLWPENLGLSPPSFRRAQEATQNTGTQNTETQNTETRGTGAETGTGGETGRWFEGVEWSPRLGNLRMTPLLTGNTTATFPPLLPNAANREEVKEYIRAMMQSMWHLAGTAALGSVVDSQFRVKGINKLSVVDSSVLTQITRLNPTQTVMALGRYAGVLKLRDIVP